MVKDRRPAKEAHIHTLTTLQLYRVRKGKLLSHRTPCQRKYINSDAYMTLCKLTPKTIGLEAESTTALSSAYLASNNIEQLKQVT